MNRLILELVQGLFIGAGAILPGISGASLAVVFGFYEELTSLVAHPARNLRSFFGRHWSLAAGIAAGFAAVTLLLGRIFGDNPFPVLYLFCGFIAGTLPGILRDARRNGAGIRELFSFSVTAGIMLTFAILHWSHALWLPGAPFGTDYTATTNTALTGIPGIWILSGAIIGAGSLLPGVSASFILVYLGLYGPMLDAAAEFSIPVLLEFAGGALAALMILSRAAGWLYKRFHGIMTSGVLGFTLGSLLLVFPGLPPGTMGAGSLDLAELAGLAALALSGLAISLFLGRKAD